MAKVDFVEVGFLRNVDEYNEDITVCNTIEELNRLLPDKSNETLYSAMAMQNNYDISKLSMYSGHGIEMIRITAHDYDIEEGLDFAREVKKKGYKLSINPINIMGYSDEKILWIISQVNQIQPYQFSIVDTFGSMQRNDLDRIVSLVDNNLDKNIRVALHLHENMSLSCCLAQQFIDKHLKRPVAVDGSLFGMGRIPGNLPIELIADYLNNYADKSYDIDYMLDAIHDYIEPLKGATQWGYTAAYFLSARFNLHRNYAEYYLGKGDLTTRDIDHILAGFERCKKSSYDPKYAECKYGEYKNNIIDDTDTIKKLQTMFTGRKILIIAPGYSIVKEYEKIQEYIDAEKPIVMSINFAPEKYNCDYAFFSNSKRFSQLVEVPCQTIITSNIETERDVFRLDYNKLSGSFAYGNNSYVMALKFLADIGTEMVTVAGADGYKDGVKNYYNPTLTSNSEKDVNYNFLVGQAVRKLDIKVNYLTKSEYE
jgi:4-hydroxy 2-oxovalerate aldolase